MGKYFGTDGVRGVAGADLTCEMAMLIGRGAAAVLTCAAAAATAREPAPPKSQSCAPIIPLCGGWLPGLRTNVSLTGRKSTSSPYATVTETSNSSGHRTTECRRQRQRQCIMIEPLRSQSCRESNNNILGCWSCKPCATNRCCDRDMKDR